MKMEHAVRAPKDGTVERLLVSEGQMVGLGDLLVEMA
jgi:biotin carboxyl carrier protein